MPKLRRPINDEDEFTDEEEEENEEEAEIEEEVEEEKPIRPIGRPILKSNLKPAIKEPKRRFGIIAPQTLKIVDTETNEVIGDGDFAVIQALTDILERLERIETQIGTTLQ